MFRIVARYKALNNGGMLMGNVEFENR